MVPSPPHVIPHSLRQKHLWAAGKMSILTVPCPIYHSPFSINPKKVRYAKVFFSFIMVFLFALRWGVSKNSNFEFLEPKLAIQENHLVLIKGSSEEHSEIIQKQSGKPTKNPRKPTRI
ncbi:hypothetical protein MTR67_007961 [Solanum verrucosum]|uniref:Uncharacterized protein n=1 Tax=Solanum verrucosum TaxID=315347 RepID=A0AAF0Q5Z7_SOLVR|nr:hypothetical protein MTR67_007961 [Solanum verrucosum]